MQISPIPAFSDNYLWLLENGSSAAVVDPGDAVPVRAELNKRKINLDYILITHHHSDHTGGIRTLKRLYPNAEVFGPGCGRIPCLDTEVKEGDTADLGTLGSYRVMEVPGHTSSHIAYYGERSLFIGDTVFAAGCGRLFEGTAAQMVNSFNKLRQLPEETLIYCAHEYTINNIRFAKEADPYNSLLLERERECLQKRQRNLPTVPFTLKEELATNPFFRCGTEALQHSAGQRAGKEVDNEIEAFSVIRKWKNSF